jgi:hypothetical protein
MENKITLADILRVGLDEYLGRYGPLPHHHYKVINAMLACKTDKLGAHVFQCPECDYQKIAYNSCRNRHCPACQAISSARWTQRRAHDVLPVKYFHIVFTIPGEINPVALQNKKAFYNLLFKAGSETLRELAGSRKWLGADIGFFAVLHTWGQNLLDHPHIHCVVPGGGLSQDKRRWKPCRKNYLFPVKVMSRLFRGKFLAYLKEAIQAGTLTFQGQLDYLNQADNRQSLVSGLYAKEWVVYAKPPFNTPLQVIKYLSRYTHKIAISNRRIIGLSNGKVTFTWKDYRNQNKRKFMTLEKSEFIRRFMLHVLPSGFMRIRYFGILGNRIKSKMVALGRKLLGNISQMAETVLLDTIKIPLLVCPHCKKGVLTFRPLIAGVWPGG